MKVIIDPYRGGVDTGRLINNKYEKNLLLKLSYDLCYELNKVFIDSELIRDNDIFLSNNDRINIVDTICEDGDIVIENRLNYSDNMDIIYSVKSNSMLAYSIYSDLLRNNIKCNYFNKRLSDKNCDYYIFLEKINNSLIIYYNDIVNYKNVIKIIAKSIKDFVINNKNITYI